MFLIEVNGTEDFTWKGIYRPTSKTIIHTGNIRSSENILLTILISISFVWLHLIGIMTLLYSTIKARKSRRSVLRID